MPNVKVHDMQGNEVSNIDLPEAVFGIKPNIYTMHQMVVNYLASQRQGTQSALTRSEVSGGGKKPWRQKGTGHARQGSTRSPQWRHGGVVFAPKPRDYTFSVNKKVRRLALKSAFASKYIDQDLIILDTITLNEFKTKIIVGMLKALNLNNKKVLIVLPSVNQKIINSARNIQGVKTAQVNTINVYDIMKANKLIICQGALEKIEEVYS